MATSKRDMRWLQKRGQAWYAVAEVPRGLRTKIGKRRLLKSLKTQDYHVAVVRRHAALAEFQAVFAQARGAVAAGSVTEAALAWRQTFDALSRGDRTAFAVNGPDGPVTDTRALEAFAVGLLEDEAADIEHEHGSDVAREFAGLARGTSTPLLLHLDAWLAEGGIKGPLNVRTRTMYRADLNAVAAWAKSMGVATVEAFSNKVAGRFVTEELVGKGVHWGSANRKISSASSYWRWLMKRAGVTSNPWAGQSLAKSQAHRSGARPKRPFTDQEVAALLAGPAGVEMADAMRIAALTGARLEEIYRLTTADCLDGWFSIRVAKTRAGVRRVPIHPALVEIVARRCGGKAPSGFLMHEPGPARAGRERSAAVSKRFGHFRQACGVHERADGARHSAVDFHSWRRWFVTRARQAGVDRAVVAAVVGHETGSITDDVYSGGPSDAQLIACVAAVHLPTA